MKKLILIITMCFMTGLAFGQQSMNQVVEDVGPGLVNWSQGIIYAEGCGAPRKNQMAAQARIMAKRAATADAYRNLLETVKGVNVTGETTVENFMTTSDIVRTRVTGIVKGARQIGKEKYLDDGSVCVTYAMRMHGALTQTLVEDGDPLFKKEDKKEKKVEIKYNPKIPEPKHPEPPPPPKKIPPPPPPPPKKVVDTKPDKKPWKQPDKKPDNKPIQPPNENFNPSKNKWDGLIIDARQSGLKPALMPKIYNASGAVIYSKDNVNDQNTIRSGVVGYAKEMEAAKRHFRVAKDPLVIQAINAKGTNLCDPVISNGAAKYIQTTEPYSSYLKQGRVMFLFN